jgi:hypothetical protein
MISFGTNIINIVITNYLEKEKPFLEIAVREKVISNDSKCLCCHYSFLCLNPTMGLGIAP